MTTNPSFQRESSSPYKAMLDSVPLPVLLVDDDLNIIDYNNAGGDSLGSMAEGLIKRRGGDLFHCLHSSENPEGCGHSPSCADCVIRGAVNLAIEGSPVTRARERIFLRRNDQLVEAHFLVTTSTVWYEGSRYALLILENINDLISLKTIIPICAHCRKVRDDDYYWHTVESYRSNTLPFDFSHGICPDCIRSLYPTYSDKENPIKPHR